MDISRVLPPVRVSASNVVRDMRRGAALPYHPEHIVASLRAALHVKNKDKLKASLRASIQWFFPQEWQAIARKNAARELSDTPDATTLMRNAFRLDCAAMLLRRQWYRDNGPTYRYLAYDASPQRGHEYFVTVERVVRRSALQAASAEAKPHVETRLLPLCVLGCGRMGLAEKVQTHIHQVWLEYGPSAAAVRSANLDVRQCLSDMGTEFGIADARDVVAECLGQPRETVAASSLLYPLALVVPGPQHIIDTSLQRGLQSLPWWPEWQRVAKIVCQWLRPANHRALLQNRLRQRGGDPETLASRLASLDKGCDGFAEWRWKTLASVTKDLIRMEHAVSEAASTVKRATELASRDGGVAAQFLASAQDPEFWANVSALARLVAPLASFSGWLRGCDCHEADRLAKRKVFCDWQGCRAKSLASRVETAMVELDALRRGALQSTDLAGAATAMLASLQTKMAWVFEEPYLIWKAPQVPEMCRSSLQMAPPDRG